MLTMFIPAHDFFDNTSRGSGSRLYPGYTAGMHARARSDLKKVSVLHVPLDEMLTDSPGYTACNEVVELIC